METCVVVQDLLYMKMYNGTSNQIGSSVTIPMHSMMAVIYQASFMYVRRRKLHVTEWEISIT